MGVTINMMQNNGKARYQKHRIMYVETERSDIVLAYFKISINRLGHIRVKIIIGICYFLSSSNKQIMCRFVSTSWLYE